MASGWARGAASALPPRPGSGSGARSPTASASPSPTGAELQGPQPPVKTSRLDPEALARFAWRWARGRNVNGRIALRSWCRRRSGRRSRDQALHASRRRERGVEQHGDCQRASNSRCQADWAKQGPASATQGQAKSSRRGGVDATSRTDPGGSRPASAARVDSAVGATPQCGWRRSTAAFTGSHD